jgi:hypothetical protein
VALVVFLNFFVVTLLLGIGWAYRLVQKEDRAFSICLAKVWHAQNDQKKILEKLLRLNAQVAKLRAARTQAQIRLAAAVASGAPPAIAAAKAHLSYVNAQLLVLHNRQQVLLANANIVARNFNTVTKFAIAQRTTAQHIAIDEMSLAVVASPPNEIAPFYSVREPFALAQRAGAKWKIKNLRGSCHATLDKRGGRWFIQMYEDKS